MAAASQDHCVGFDGVRRPMTGGRSPSDTRRRTTAFSSILFARLDDHRADEGKQPPPFFDDLNCDQIVEAVTADRDEYDLKPFFYAGLPRIDAVEYRHEVMQDLERPGLQDHVSALADGMRAVRQHLAKIDKMYCKEQKEAWFLDSIVIYCELISAFTVSLVDFDLRSRGFLAFRNYITSYAQSKSFTSLHIQAKKLKAELAVIEYCVLIIDNGFTVQKYEGEGDYSTDVESTFEKFKQGAVKDYKVRFAISEDMNHVEAKILEFVAKLHADLFGALAAFCVTNGDFIDRTIAVFDREVQFYIAYLDYIAPLRQAGLPFCYPALSETDQEVSSHGGFDIALAHKLLKEDGSVVCNDFDLQGGERILVVSGPNQGGKTTFARMFGQLHYLAKIGCPVPGRDSKLLFFDRLFTHFEKEEKVENLRGKLEDDLFRIHGILEQTTPVSVVVLNEIFTSTTIQDETFLSEKIMERLVKLRALCVWVTFVDELASFGPQVVSMVSTVVPEDPARRTFKILRLPADGLAYALAIAQRYELTYDMIRRRIKP